MAHIHEKIDWTVEVYIVHDKTVLLRRHDKYGIWLSVGGHIELDEDSLQAAKRECLEEVGLDVAIHGESDCKTWDRQVTDVPTPAGMYRHPINETHEHVSIIYFGTSESNEVTPEKPGETWQWFTKEEIDTHQEIDPLVKRYALEVLELIPQD